ncbi:MAG: PAS domain-containing sensor histidine kinase, partial [Acidimicrobiales bacterium]
MATDTSDIVLVLAGGVVLIGVALVLSHDPGVPPPRAALVASGLSGLSAVAVTLHLERMAITTAVGLVVAAAGVWLLRFGRRGLAHLCGVVISLGAWVVLSAYIYQVAPVGEPGSDGTWPLVFAIGLDVVGLGLIWSSPSFGLLGLARRGASAGLLIRGAVPLLVGFPLGVGWANVAAVRSGLYAPEFSVAVMAMAMGAVSGLVLWYMARSIVAHDEARAEAMRALADTNLRLEQQVLERTSTLEAQTAIQMASFEALEQGVAVCSMDAEVLLLNRAGRELLGYEADELTQAYQRGGLMVQREDGSTLPTYDRALVRTMRDGETVSGLVVKSLTKDGRDVVLRVSTQPIFDDEGEQTGAVVALADITTERAAQLAVNGHVAAVTELNARLERAVRMKDRLLSTATHDMRSPIATVIGFSELLSRDDLPVPDDKRLVYLDAIHRQGRRLEALVQDLVSVAVIDGAAISFDPRPVDLDAAFRQAAMDARMEDHVEIRDPDAAVAFVDPLRLAQILTNLLQNAARYGRAPFVLAATREDADVVVRVSDHGDGVDPGFVPQLFDPYSMAPARPGVESTGTGLGLAIVRGLAELQGGEAWYEPNDPT